MKTSKILLSGLSLFLLFFSTTANLKSEEFVKRIIGHMKSIQSDAVIENVPGYETEYTPLGNGIERRKF